jgi:hypothetical protein
VTVEDNFECRFLPLAPMQMNVHNSGYHDGAPSIPNVTLLPCAFRVPAATWLQTAVQLKDFLFVL